MVIKLSPALAGGLRVSAAFLAAVVTAYLLAAPLATQVMLAEVRGMGLSLTLTDYLRATAADLRGMAASYLPLIALAFLPALAGAALLGRRFRRGRFLFYPIAGALSLPALHLVMEALLGWNFFAAVRGEHGLLLQGCAGWVGGYAFLLFTGQATR